MKIARLFVLLSVTAFGFSCSNRSSSDEADAFLDSLENNSIENTTMISEEVISDVIQQIPSPMEMSMLIKNSGMEYENNILSDPEKYTTYNTSYKQAINLGIYGSDLIYTNIFERNQDGMAYIKAVKSLADELNIGQFFNLKLITSLAMNNNNLDSLLLITVRNFNDINKHLQKQKRSNLSVLLLIGGWLEGVYINCEMVTLNPDNAQLVEKVGEQKMILENIMLLLEFYAKSDPYIDQLKGKLNTLKEAFQEVEIKYVYKDPTYEVVNGVLSIMDNSTSEIIITSENVVNIASIVREIRNSMI